MYQAFTTSMIGFMITFMVAGSALVYGIGEFPAAVKAKDDCVWDKHLEDFKECKGQSIQENLNFIAFPLGNFTLPGTVAIGMIIDKYGFIWPGIITIASVQAFIASLWLFDLTGQYMTLIFYNLAYSSLFTVQNAYICSVRQEFIGGLFAISNIVLSAGNFVAMWLNTNPFGQGPEAVRSSLMVSCISLTLVMFPLYLWPGFLEAKDHKTGLAAL
jgi:tetrahydromethanopterin S-methyltransferase subunit D